MTPEVKQAVPKEVQKQVYQKAEPPKNWAAINKRLSFAGSWRR